MDERQAKLLKKHAIVALDLNSEAEALELARKIRGHIDKVKVGSHLFTQSGPRILDDLHRLGLRVFLDLKFHDIPSVVEKACASVSQHPAVFLLTIHASGGPNMVRGACQGARTRDVPLPPTVVAVTALTSMSPMELSLAGVQTNLEDYAEKLALMATDAGADGVVCSPLEVERLARVLPTGSVFVTPGIRSEAVEGDDQTRIMSAAQAIKAGSTFIVIGRPVYLASDPVQALEAIGASL